MGTEKRQVELKFELSSLHSPSLCLVIPTQLKHEDIFDVLALRKALDLLRTLHITPKESFYSDCMCHSGP